MNNCNLSSADQNSAPTKRTSSKVVLNECGVPIGIECRCGKTILLDEDLIPKLSLKRFSHDGSQRTRVSTKVDGKRINIARLVIDVPDGMLPDHINSNIHDNRRINLRVCTFHQNTQNKKRRAGGTSKYTGVCWFKRTSKWLARYSRNGSHVFIGSFDNEVDAAIARDDHARREYGEFAKLNFPERYGITYP